MAIASGKSVGSSATGRISHIAPAKPKPSVSSKQPIDQLAGDTTYKQQSDAAHRGLADYQSQMAASQGQYNTDYTRNLYNQNKQENVDQEAQANDFASRGMSHSGLRIQAATKLHAGYDDRSNSLNEGQAAFNSNLQSGLQNFKSTQRLNDTRYRNEAINRRAVSLSAGL